MHIYARICHGQLMYTKFEVSRSFAAEIGNVTPNSYEIGRIWLVRGQSMSLRMVPFDRLSAASY